MAEINPDAAAYESLLLTDTEFSSDGEQLAWDADGWEELTCDVD